MGITIYFMQTGYHHRCRYRQATHDYRIPPRHVSLTALSFSGTMRPPPRHQHSISRRVAPRTDHRAIDRPPAPCPQTNSPPEEREVSVPGHRWGTTHVVPSLLVTSGHRAVDGNWEPRPSKSRQGPSCKKGLSIASPFSHGASVLPRNQSQHLAAHDAPPAGIAVRKVLNGIWPLGLTFHTAMRRGAVIFPASSSTGAPL
jgi:hypothetical protein